MMSTGSPSASPTTRMATRGRSSRSAGSSSAVMIAAMPSRNRCREVATLRPSRSSWTSACPSWWRNSPSRSTNACRRSMSPASTRPHAQPKLDSSRLEGRARPASSKAARASTATPTPRSRSGPSGWTSVTRRSTAGSIFTKPKGTYQTRRSSSDIASRSRSPSGPSQGIRPLARSNGNRARGSGASRWPLGFRLAGGGSRPSRSSCVAKVWGCSASTASQALSRATGSGLSAGEACADAAWPNLD